MVALVTKAEVAVIVGNGIDPGSDLIPPAIAVADLIVTEDLAGSTLTTARKTQIELYLAAHFVQLSEYQGPLAADSLGEATERYHDIYAAGLRATRFGQQAIALDTSLVLTKLADAAENPQKKEALFTVVGDPTTNPLEDTS
jgi:hypothetical protein